MPFSFISPSLFPPCLPPTVPTTRAAHPLYFGFLLFRLSTPTHPPFHPPLPTPVINFSTKPLSFFLVSSLLSLHFPLLFFSPHHHFFRFSYISLRKKWVGFTVSAFSVASQKRGTGHAAVQRDGTICELTQNSQFRQSVVLDITKQLQPSLRR
jgi:hypothetical protein